MTSGWQQYERGSPSAVRFMRWAARRLGRVPARLLLYPITLYFFVTSRQGRTASYDFLRRILDRSPTWRDVFRHMHTFAAVILDRVYFILGDVERFDVQVHGYSEVANKMGERGAVMLGTHLGSFDAVRCMAIMGYSVELKVMMHYEQNQYITQALEALNPSIAETVIPIGREDSLLQAMEWVERGGCIGLLGDRVTSVRRACQCEFLGGHALFPTGPWWLARRLEVPVILFFGIYRGGKRYDIYLEELEWPEQYQDSKEIERVLAQRYAYRVEHYVREAPYNWFNFYPFWVDGSDPNGSGIDSSGPSKGH
ncbi:lipid A biosynthesis acyltransferase [Halorhodospira halochloris]|uniref:LpxL/LpxP family acyltransferase n=1 Tax=Halorhodospira halochloris TaxID=1052 RepID=UPI001EE9645F|nr:lipid A biosynthesis acyltransferase [Halorhodospira halochloris]MCG5529941.1 lipid A biosynthesis acyltransferase [Halorhodospira halochloris]